MSPSPSRHLFRTKPARISGRHTRRAFLFAAAAVGASLPRLRAFAAPSTGATAPPSTAAPAGPFTLPPLPYAEDALAPVIGAQTMSFHYGKHHRAYVDNLNKAVVGTEYAAKSLDAVIAATAGTDRTLIFNNAAQLAHHTFYWSSMKPGGGGAPPAGPLLDLVNTSFGGPDKLRAEWAEKATKLFGSGWCWLTLADGTLRIEPTKNAELPAGRPLLVIDVWEHAYYLDYQNRRGEYVNAWLDRLVSWDEAAKRLAAAG